MTRTKPLIAQDSFWIRAPRSGSFMSYVNLGKAVSKGDLLAIISDPFGRGQEKIEATEVVIAAKNSDENEFREECSDLLFHLLLLLKQKDLCLGDIASHLEKRHYQK